MDAQIPKFDQVSLHDERSPVSQERVWVVTIYRDSVPIDRYVYRSYALAKAHYDRRWQQDGTIAKKNDRNGK